MGAVLHAIATATLALFVWASLGAVAARTVRAGQVEFALWLLGSDRAAPWWKNHPTVTAALLDATRSPRAQLAAGILTSACALAASFALWAALSWYEFLAWITLLHDSPAANVGMVAIPALFVMAATYFVGRTSDRVAMSMARTTNALQVIAWMAIDAAASVVLALAGWLGFLASLIVSGREQEFAHLITRAQMEIDSGWTTGLTFAVDRSGWPSWGVWFYAILLVAALPWLHALAAWILRRSIRHAKPIIERVDALGILDLEGRPLGAIAAVAAATTAAIYGTFVAMP